jgi:hypothetical protein
MKRVAVAVCLVCLAVAGCKGNKALTKENYDKIEAGMALADVQTLLGGPGEEDVELNLPDASSVAGAIGVGGTIESMTPRKSATKWYKWGGSSKWIKVAFLDGEVAASNFKQSEGLR